MNGELGFVCLLLLCLLEAFLFWLLLFVCAGVDVGLVLVFGVWLLCYVYVYLSYV